MDKLCLFCFFVLIFFKLITFFEHNKTNSDPMSVLYLSHMEDTDKMPNLELEGKMLLREVIFSLELKK